MKILLRFCHLFFGASIVGRYEQSEMNWLPVHRSEVAVAQAVFEWKRPALLNALVPFH